MRAEFFVIDRYQIYRFEIDVERREQGREREPSKKSRDILDKIQKPLTYSN